MKKMKKIKEKLLNVHSASPIFPAKKQNESTTSCLGYVFPI